MLIHLIPLVVSSRSVGISMIAVKSSFLPKFFIAMIHVDQPGKMFRQSSTSQSPMTLVSWRSSVEDVEVLRHL